MIKIIAESAEITKAPHRADYHGLNIEVTTMGENLESVIESIIDEHGIKKIRELVNSEHWDH